MITDTIADMLTRIRNANLVKHQIVRIPSTKMTRNLCTILANEGLIECFDELKEGVKKYLFISLKYSGKRRIPLIKGISRVSKPGLRIYNKYAKMPKVLGGYGIGIVSTSKGLMTDKKARKERVGGEMLCHIW